MKIIIHNWCTNLHFIQGYSLFICFLSAISLKHWIQYIVLTIVANINTRFFFLSKVSGRMKTVFWIKLTFLYFVLYSKSSSLYFSDLLLFPLNLALSFCRKLFFFTLVLSIKCLSQLRLDIYKDYMLKQYEISNI